MLLKGVSLAMWSHETLREHECDAYPAKNSRTLTGTRLLLLESRGFGNVATQKINMELPLLRQLMDATFILLKLKGLLVQSYSEPRRSKCDTTHKKAKDDSPNRRCESLLSVSATPSRRDSRLTSIGEYIGLSLAAL